MEGNATGAMSLVGQAEVRLHFRSKARRHDAKPQADITCTVFMSFSRQGCFSPALGAAVMTKPASDWRIKLCDFEAQAVVL